MNAAKTRGWALRENKKIRVVCGMSGGVDSAISAYILKQQGYDVLGVFMKNWQDDGEGCNAAQDYEDVKSVCLALDIPYYTVNFEREYYDRVFRYFLDEYSRGRTPNPDVLCNSEIKFAAFLEHAQNLGAENLATGHYARTDGRRLMRAVDFQGSDILLCMLSPKRSAQPCSPSAVCSSPRCAPGRSAGLRVADKDSTGICFIGERKFRGVFIGLSAQAQRYHDRTARGGRHQGVMYYTQGQRRGSASAERARRKPLVCGEQGRAKTYSTSSRASRTRCIRTRFCHRPEHYPAARAVVRCTARCFPARPEGARHVVEEGARGFERQRASRLVSTSSCISARSASAAALSIRYTVREVSYGLHAVRARRGTFPERI